MMMRQRSPFPFTLFQTKSSASTATDRPVVDDADAAAGQTAPNNSLLMTHTGPSLRTHMMAQLESAPSSVSSVATLNMSKGHPPDLEFFDDLVSEPVLVLGIDISHLSRQYQFAVCAVGVFGFSLLYGYLQELISVEICNRQLGLFLAMVQFFGYTVLAYWLRNFVYEKQKRMRVAALGNAVLTVTQPHPTAPDSKNSLPALPLTSAHAGPESIPVPLLLYLGLSLLRAVDLAMTNLAMQHINYPAKTLMKSSRIVFTMLFGVVIGRKVYHVLDYLIVLTMVAGLGLFMHADANSAAVFHHMGVIMLTVSLLCDGAISNMSENIMSNFGVGQDEFIFRMYSIAFLAITFAAYIKGDLMEGMVWMFEPGTYDERHLPVEERTWTVGGKLFVMILFSSMGFFGSSCSAAITKQFGALTMSITSTARKATTLFLSFFLFNNVCTLEHVVGIVIFIGALTAKSLRRGNKAKKSPRRKRTKSAVDVRTIGTNASDEELGGGGGLSSENNSTGSLSTHHEGHHSNMPHHNSTRHHHHQQHQQAALSEAVRRGMEEASREAAARQAAASRQGNGPPVNEALNLSAHGLPPTHPRPVTSINMGRTLRRHNSHDGTTTSPESQKITQRSPKRRERNKVAYPRDAAVSKALYPGIV